VGALAILVRRGVALPRAQRLEAVGDAEVGAGGACAPEGTEALRAVDLEPALAAEMSLLDEEGRRLQLEASRMAQESRQEYEAWFEAGLLLRRASDRLAKIVRRLHDNGRTAGLSDVRSPIGAV